MIGPERVMKTRVKSLLIAAGAVFGLGVLAAPAQAQDSAVPLPPPPPAEEPAANEPTTDAPEAKQANRDADPPAATSPEVVVTATRTTKRVFDVPGAAYVQTAQELRDHLVRTLPEALKETPGVLVQKTSHGQGSPIIRGFTGFRNILLIDGIRLNNSVFRDGPNEYWGLVDPLTIDRLEVIKGPGSVLWGSEGVGGTVSAFTRSPYSYGEGFNWDARAYYRFHSGEQSHIGRGEFSAGWGEKFGIYSGFSGKDFGDVQAGGSTGNQPNTGYEEYDFDGKGEFFLNENMRFVFAHQRVRQNNVPRTHRTPDAESFRGTAIGNELRHDFDQERRLSYLQFHAENGEEWVKSFRASLSWDEREEDRDRLRTNNRRDFQGFDVGTLGVWVQMESQTPIGLLTYGVDYYRDNVSSYSSSSPIQGPIADDASYDLFGVFVQDEIEVNDRLTLILGGRYNYAGLDANQVENPATGNQISMDDSWDSVVGSARAVYTLAPEWLNVFGGVSQGFRAPNLSDMTRLDTARSNEIETPVADLDPEYFLSFEAGMKVERGGFTGTFAYYYTLIDDMIIRTPTGNTIDGALEVTKQNAGDGYVHGFEIAMRQKLTGGWSVWGQMSWMFSDVDEFASSDPVESEGPLTREMPINGQAGIRWDWEEKRAWIETFGTWFDEADRLNASDIRDTQRIPPGGTPGFSVYTIRGGVRVCDNVDLTLALENFTDENYRYHGSGSNEPGRSFVVSVDIRF